VKLYWHPLSIVPRRVRIAFREKGVAYDEVEVDLPGGAHRGPEFRRLNPFAQVPVLEDGDLVIAESVAILEYLEERFPTPALLPADAASRAVARQFMLWAGDYIAPAWEAWMAPWFKGVPADDPSVRQARDAIAAHLDVLETHLRDRTWLVGEYSLADVCYAPVVTVLDRVRLGDLLTGRPALRAWVERLLARPAVRDTAPPPVRL
jgi:glutathione S-transferase